MEETGNSLAELRSRSNQPLAINRPAPLPILHFCLDIAFILTLFLGLEVLARNVGPHESGFFCQDKSIRMPFEESTFSLSALIFYCFTLNFVLVFCVEAYRGIKLPNKFYSKFEQYRSTWEKIGIRFAIFFGYYFAFELLIVSITTYTKYPVGRLRPHFIAVCRPMMELSSGNRSIFDGGCAGLEEVFLTNYTCLGDDKAAIKEARLSFFSGHSSLAMGASTYAILYLQFRLAGKTGCKLAVPVLQVIIGGMGLFISYSRIFDFKHHWTDVAVGICVGMLVMSSLCRFVAGFFTNHPFVEPAPEPLKRHPSQDPTTSVSTKRSFEWSEAYA